MVHRQIVRRKTVCQRTEEQEGRGLAEKNLIWLLKQVNLFTEPLYRLHGEAGAWLSPDCFPPFQRKRRSFRAAACTSGQHGPRLYKIEIGRIPFCFFPTFEKRKSRKSFLISCWVVSSVDGQYSVLKFRFGLPDKSKFISLFQVRRYLHQMQRHFSLYLCNASII